MNLRRPPSLSAAFAFARKLSVLHQETHFAASAQKAAVSDSTPRPATINLDSSQPSAPSTRPDHHSLPIRKQSFEEKQIKDAQGLCYNCDQKWLRPHRCQSRLLLLFSNDEPDNDDKPTPISDHLGELVADDISLMNSLSSATHPRSLRLKGPSTPLLSTYSLMEGVTITSFTHIWWNPCSSRFSLSPLFGSMSAAAIL